MITNRHWIFISALLTLPLWSSASTFSSHLESDDQKLGDSQFDEYPSDENPQSSYIILRQSKRSEPGYNIRLMKKSEPGYNARLMKKSEPGYNARLMKRSWPGYNDRLMKRSEEDWNGNYQARLMKKSFTDYNKRLMKRSQSLFK